MTPRLQNLWVAVLTLVATPVAGAQSFDTWEQYLGGADSSQYSSLDQIDRTNVNELQVAWTYSTGPGSYRFNPLIVDGVMYLLTESNTFVALDAATGATLWTHRNDGPVGNRGMNYWENEEGNDRRLLYVNGGFLRAIDAGTGERILTFGNEGGVDLRDGLDRDTTGVRPLQTNNPGRIFEDLLIVSLPASGAQYASTPGDIQAYDVQTGQLEWVFHTVPQPGEYGSDTWPESILPEAGGVHNWSELTVDTERGIAFVPLGTARYDFYGGNRLGANLYGNSVLAFNARTGQRLWHYQTLHHDLWDYDLPTAPKLLRVNHDGEERDVVVQVTKYGFVFVFDRETGEPLWPIEERPVPQSDVPGEESWPTQPFPTAPPPFSRPGFGVEDINPYLPAELQSELRERFSALRNEGLFTPPSFEGSMRHAGGANWGGAAVDPTRGTLYVTSQELPTISRLRLPGAGGRGRGGRGRGGQPPPMPGNADGTLVPYLAPLEFVFADNGISAIGPPWSQLTAYDLNDGEILWQVPNGEVGALAEQGMTETGSQTPRSGPLVTGGGIIFIATSSDRTLRAYDQDDGEVLWEFELESGSEGVPATYQVDGRQYFVVCVAAGNGTFPVRLPDQAEPGPGRYIVFALPE